MTHLAPSIRTAASGAIFNPNLTVATDNTPQVGDLLVAFHTNDWDNATIMTAPSGTYTAGWSNQFTDSNGAITNGIGDDGVNNSHIKVWTHRVDTAGVQTVTTNQSAINSFQTLHLYVIKNWRAIDFGVGASTARSTSTVTFGSFTIAENNSLVLIGASMKGSGDFTTNPAGMTKGSEQDVNPNHTGAVFSGTFNAGVTSSLTAQFSPNVASAAHVALSIKGAQDSRTNLFKAPSFELASPLPTLIFSRTGRSPVGSTGAPLTLARTTGDFFAGAYATEISVSSTDTSTSTTTSDFDFRMGPAGPGFTPGVVAGQTYTFSMAAKAQAPTGVSARAIIVWKNASGTTIAAPEGGTTERRGPQTNFQNNAPLPWTRFTVSGVAPAGAVAADLQFWLYGITTTTARFIRFDAVLFEAFPYMDDYFDGSFSSGLSYGKPVAAAWTGTAHNSTSTLASWVTAVQASAGLTVNSSVAAAARFVRKGGTAALTVNSTVTSSATHVKAGRASVNVNSQLTSSMYVVPAKQGSVSLTVSTATTSALTHVKALGWQGPVVVNQTAVARVVAPLTGDFEASVYTDVTMQKVWQPESELPVVIETYGYMHRVLLAGSDLPVDMVNLGSATIGERPPGFNIIVKQQLYVPASRRGRRYIAQDILTGEFLHWDLPIIEDEIEFVLSGSKTISGRLDPEHPEIAELLADNRIRARKTWIHAEEDNQILASGILQPGSIDDQSLTIDAAGFMSYPHLIPFRGVYEGIQVDPLNIVRMIWSHVQSYPDGNIGVIVDPTVSPVRIGTAPRDVNFETAEGESVSFTAGPYTLNWWEATNCGEEIDKLAKEAPIDYLELDYWNDDKTDVLHRMKLGYPRVGGYKSGLKFAQDENIDEIVPLTEDPEMGVTSVFFTGAGEGSSMVHAEYIGPNNGGIRHPIVIEDDTVTRSERAYAFAADEYFRRQATVGVDSIVVNLHHENAKFGTFQVGDDILVQARVPYKGRIAIVHRITAFTVSGGQGILKLRPSSTFRYGFREDS